MSKILATFSIPNDKSLPYMTMGFSDYPMAHFGQNMPLSRTKEIINSLVANGYTKIEGDRPDNDCKTILVYGDNLSLTLIANIVKGIKVYRENLDIEPLHSCLDLEAGFSLYPTSL